MSEFARSPTSCRRCRLQAQYHGRATRRARPALSPEENAMSSNRGGSRGPSAGSGSRSMSTSSPPASSTSAVRRYLRSAAKREPIPAEPCRVHGRTATGAEIIGRSGEGGDPLHRGHPRPARTRRPCRCDCRCRAEPSLAYFSGDARTHLRLPAGLPVRCDNEANLAALAELRFGSDGRARRSCTSRPASGSEPVWWPTAAWRGAPMASPARSATSWWSRLARCAAAGGADAWKRSPGLPRQTTSLPRR